MHYIQRHILDTLIHAKTLRNRDMRPPNVESNLYQYHLLQLRREGYIAKDDANYFLTGGGLAYADRHSTTLKKTRSQPKLITTLFLTNEQGQILLTAKSRQPFMGMYNLPSGKIHLEETINSAAEREISEKVGEGVSIDNMEHFGVAHITIVQDDYTISDYVAFLISARVSNVQLTADATFVSSSDDCSHLQLMPSVTELLAAYNSKANFIEHTIRMEQ